MTRVAVDFGTSNTVIARTDEATGQTRTVEIPGITRALRYRLDADGEDRVIHLVPSVIHYSRTEILVGQQVVDRGLAADRGTVQWIKRRISMGVKKRTRTPRGHVAPDEAGRDFLRLVLTYAGDEVSMEGDEFVFTAPVEAFEDFEDWLRRVAESIGIQRIRMMDEATAAILGYREAIQRESRFVVFDFGCGTLDVSAVRVDLDSISDRKAIQLGRAGLDLGGLDVDSWLLEDFSRRHQLDAAVQRRLEARLLREAERVKIELSDPAVEESCFVLEHGPGGPLKSLYRRECDRCARARRPPTSEDGDTSPCLGCVVRSKRFLPEIEATVDRALENAAIQVGMRRSEISRIVVTGGTSLLPSIRAYLEERFVGKVDYQNPFDAVVRGACQGLVVPILQHDYAIESFDPRRREYEFKPLFSGGTGYPTRPGAVRFWARGSYNGMTRIGVKIYEVSAMKRRNLEVSLVDWEGALQDPSRVQTDCQYVCLNRDNPTFILADPPVNLERDGRRFLCAFHVDGQRRLLICVRDNLAQKTLLEDHPVVRL